MFMVQLMMTLVFDSTIHYFFIHLQACRMCVWAAEGGAPTAEEVWRHNDDGALAGRVRFWELQKKKRRRTNDDCVI